MSRFTAKNGHVRRNQGCPLRAKSEMTCFQIHNEEMESGQADKQITYSITSLALASSVVGTVRPSAFAVLRLITNSYLVGACTGRSAGFSPLRMRSTYPAARRYWSTKSAP